MKDANNLKKYSYSVIMIGYVGLKGTAILAENFRQKLDERFPLYLSREALTFGDGEDKNAFDLARKALTDHIEKHGATIGEDAYFVEVKEGGFLTGLYELANECGLGFELDLRKIPVRQETIEICELLEVNPYHLYSEACIIAIVPEAGALVTNLLDEGINAVIVGHTTDKKAHILHNDGTESHLNRPEPDELERLGLT